MKPSLKRIFVIITASAYMPLLAQYAPGVGVAGTTAIYKDSAVFVNWAVSCQVKRGYQDVSNITLGFASAGDSTMATGKAQSNGAVSLGDGGMATCMFQYPVKNGPGPDFAVFENGFDDSFLELAFVEVSSDGINYSRFKSHSLTDTTQQTASFGLSNPVKLNNFAGKYRGGYGTPFDLEELAGITGLNLNAITHIRVVDVVGSVNKLYATRDGFGNKVNDPWPTPFATGGFDLDAIGVMHQNSLAAIHENGLQNLVQVYPNPASEHVYINLLPGFAGKNGSGDITLQLRNSTGQLLNEIKLDSDYTALSMAHLPTGVYSLLLMCAKGVYTKCIIKT